jgi:signal transduction histidine kinase
MRVTIAARPFSRHRRPHTPTTELARLLDLLEDGVVVVGPRREILAWNRAAARITGIAPDQAVGRVCADAFPSADPICARLTRDGATTRHIGLLHRAADGATVRGEMRGERIGDELVLVLRDAAAAAAIDQIKADFIATASHELRTPVTSIFGAAVTLRRRLQLRGADEELLNTIALESQRLWELVEHLLAAHAARLRELQVQLEPVDAVAVCRAAAQLTAVAAPEAHVDLEAEGSVCPALAEPHVLHAAVCALLDNAVKYSDSRPQIRISVVRDEPKVRICIEDSGIGLDPATRERIFEPFARVDADMARGVGGIGLSLFIVHEQLEQMGGDVRVDEAPGGGAMFTLELAAAPFAALHGAAQPV